MPKTVRTYRRNTSTRLLNIARANGLPTTAYGSLAEGSEYVVRIAPPDPNQPGGDVLLIQKGAAVRIYAASRTHQGRRRITPADALGMLGEWIGETVNETPEPQDAEPESPRASLDLTLGLARWLGLRVLESTGPGAAGRPGWRIWAPGQSCDLWIEVDDLVGARYWANAEALTEEGLPCKPDAHGVHEIDADGARKVFDLMAERAQLGKRMSQADSPCPPTTVEWDEFIGLARRHGLTVMTDTENEHSYRAQVMSPDVLRTQFVSLYMPTGGDTRVHYWTTVPNGPLGKVDRETAERFVIEVMAAR